jgi:prepilin-type N-terminal cleavage/methylation domain-containing protein
MLLMRYRSGRGGRRGFTLVELLVVIGIIAILVTMLMPALRRARNQAAKVNCQSQLKQISGALRLYADMFNGWLPGTQAICDSRTTPSLALVPGNGATIPVDTGYLWLANCLRNKNVWLCPVDPRDKGTYQYSYTYNGRMIVRPGFEEEPYPAGNMVLNEFAQPKPEFRKITSFRRPAECLTFGEENATSVRWVGPYLINDGFFIFDDVSDDRHLGKSCAAWLDGHAGDIPARLNLYRSKEWGYCR